jgi:hypothetical protein
MTRAPVFLCADRFRSGRRSGRSTCSGSGRARRRYWDLVERHVDSLERPYLAFAIRSGDPASPDEQRVQAILDELPGHPIAARLRFTTPEVGLASIGYEL